MDKKKNCICGYEFQFSTGQVKKSFNSPCCPRGMQKLDPDQINLLKQF